MEIRNRRYMIITFSVAANVTHRYDITLLYHIIGDISHFAIEWKSNFCRLVSSCVFWEFETLFNVGNNSILTYLASSRK